MGSENVNFALRRLAMQSANLGIMTTKGSFKVIDFHPNRTPMQLLVSSGNQSSISQRFRVLVSTGGTPFFAPSFEPTTMNFGHKKPEFVEYGENRMFAC